MSLWEYFLLLKLKIPLESAHYKDILEIEDVAVVLNSCNEMFVTCYERCIAS